MASYDCIKQCGQTFKSEQGLSRHQDVCKKAQEIWAHDLKEAAENRAKAKRCKLYVGTVYPAHESQ